MIYIVLCKKNTQEDHCYFIIFIDGHLQYIKVKLLKIKDKPEEELIVLIKYAEIETDKRVNYF